MAVSAITAFLPFVTSGSIFAPRRIGKGNGRNNPILSIMDYDVAAGQTAKVVEGAANIAKETNAGLAATIAEKEKSLNAFLKADKIANGAGKVLRFTMNNINPLIGTIELGKVLFAKDEDRLRTALEGGCAFGGMLLGEGAAKEILGLSKTSYKNGKYEITERTPLYQKWIGKEQRKAINDFCETKKFMGKHVFKHAPKVAKGLLFVSASIGSYIGGNVLGEKIADTIEGKNTAKKASLNPFSQQSQIQAA